MQIIQALREIREVDSTDTITIKVPEEFKGKKVEIIVLPYTDVIPDLKDRG